MLDAALKFLFDKFQPRGVDVRQMMGADGEPDTRRYLLIDGTSVSIKEFPKRDHRAHRVARILDFVDLVNTQAKPGASIWISAESAVAYFSDAWADGSHSDDPAVNDAVILPFVSSAFYDGVKNCGIGRGVKHGQREFLQLLRRGLGPENAEAYQEQGLIGKAQNIKFLSATSGESIVTKGRDTMSVAVDKQLLSKDGELPDWILASGPLFKNPDLTELSAVALDISLDTDPDERKFVTNVDAIKYEREANRVLEAIRNKIATGIESDKIGIYLGTA